MCVMFTPGHQELKVPGLAVWKKQSHPLTDNHIHSRIATSTHRTHPGGCLDWSQLVQVHGGKLHPLGPKLLANLTHCCQLGSATECIGPVLNKAKHTLLDNGRWIILEGISLGSQPVGLVETHHYQNYSV